MIARSPLAPEALDQIFRSARTRNGWEPTPVDDATIEAIYDLAKLAPTSANSSPARFVWVRSEEGRRNLADCAMGPNAGKILAAPVTVIIGRDQRFYERMDYLFPHAPQMQAMMRSNAAMAEATASRNATLQGAYLMIAARSLGLDCGPMSGFDAMKVNNLFFAETSIATDFICTMGHGTEAGTMDRLPRLPFSEVNRIV